MLRACTMRPAVARAPRPSILLAIGRAPGAPQPCRRTVSALSVAPPKHIGSFARAPASFSAPHRLYSSQKSAATPAPMASSTTPPVDLLAKYEQKAARRQKMYRWGSVLLVIAVLIALAMWYGEGHRASTDIMECVGALQDPTSHKEPPLFHLRKLYERARTNEHWMGAVRAETVGLLEILRPYLDSQVKDERIYAALLVSYIAGGNRTLKKAIIDGGYIEQMIKYTDTPTRVATALALSQIATRWFAGEMKNIFRDNEAVVKFVNDAAEDHDPLLHAYGKRILYHTGQKSLGRQLSASNDLLIKAFDYTQRTDKEAMAGAMRDAANGEPKNAYLQFCQAYWFHLMGFAKEAKIAYTKALVINNGQVDALYELGRIYLVEFHADRTALLWARALQENPTFAPLNRWIDDFQKDYTRPDLVQLHEQLHALRSGTGVSLAKAAPLLPAELPNSPSSSAAVSAQPVSGGLGSIASTIAPHLAAGPRPVHTLPPTATQK